MNVVVDITPLDANKYRAWLIAKLFTYDMLANQDGSFAKLLPRDQFSKWGTRSVMGQHPCSVRPVSVTNVQVTAPPKAQRPVSFSSAKKAFVRDSSKGRRGFPVRNAIRPLSRPARCDVCRGRVYVSDPDVISIEHGTYIWAVHDECP